MIDVICINWNQDACVKFYKLETFFLHNIVLIPQKKEKENLS